MNIPSTKWNRKEAKKKKGKDNNKFVFDRVPGAGVINSAADLLFRAAEGRVASVVLREIMSHWQPIKTLFSRRASANG